MIFHMTSMLYSLFIYTFKFYLIKRSVNFLMPISRSTCFSFIFVAVIKYSAERNMRKENVYLAFNFRPNNKSRHGRNLKIGLFAISHSIASDQGTHSTVKKSMAGIMEDVFLLASRQASKFFDLFLFF